MLAVIARSNMSFRGDAQRRTRNLAELVKIPDQRAKRALSGMTDGPANSMTGERHDSVASCAVLPNMFLRCSSVNGVLSNLPTARPFCTFGRARTAAYQRLTCG